MRRCGWIVPAITDHQRPKDIDVSISQQQNVTHILSLHFIYLYKTKKFEKNPTHNYFCNLSDFYYLFGGYFKSDPYRYSYNIFFDFSKL